MYSTFSLLHQRKAPSSWWCSPLPCTGEGRNGLSIPRGSHPRATPLWKNFLIFYPCCPLRGRTWMALVILNDRPLFSFIFLKTFLNLFPTLNLLFIYLTNRCFLSLCFYSSAVTFTPTLALSTPALSAPVESPGETHRYNVPTVLSGCYSFALVSLLLTFEKFPWDTLGPVQCAHFPLKLLLPLPKLSPNLHLQMPAKLKNPHLRK